MITNQPRSDPGDNLDLTRNPPIWAMVEWWDSSSIPDLKIAMGGQPYYLVIMVN